MNNVLITGAAGTGKSYEIDRIVRSLKHENKTYAVTASTGTAAILIRGRTIHSYLGIGLGTADVPKLVKKTKAAIKLKLRLLEVLIIDEISMVDDILFEKISQFLQAIRGNDDPFGGVQLILVGDFAQIPPVTGDYCFKSKEWERANIEIRTLKKNWRQQEDKVFQAILAEARQGKLSNESMNILKSRTKLKKIKGIEPTILFAKNVDVDAINERMYRKLLRQGQKDADEGGLPFELFRKEYTQNVPLDLCIGAQVVLTWNISFEEGLVNGSRGVVTSVSNDSGPMVKFIGKETSTLITFVKLADKIPLKLAYALTIHKSQGMTLDYMVVDLGSSIFEYGQAYTALSRAKNLESIVFIDICKESFKTHPDVKNIYCD
jgi:ATP-dependent DNA helicase PIF1